MMGICLFIDLIAALSTGSLFGSLRSDCESTLGEVMLGSLPGVLSRLISFEDVLLPTAKLRCLEPNVFSSLDV